MLSHTTSNVYYKGYDPDDIATQITASLEDLSTLFIMAYYSEFLFDMSSTD